MKTSDHLIALDTNAKAYSVAREKLVGLVSDLESEIAALKRKNLTAIKRAAAAAAGLKEALMSEVTAHHELFEKPRSFTLHGIKVGYQKGKGKLVFDNGDEVVKRINNFFPEQRDTLVRIVFEPNKENLITCDGATLKKLGCRIEGTSDVAFVKASDSDIDKLVSALLGEGIQEDES